MVPKNQRGYTLYSKKLKGYNCLLRGAVSTTKAKNAKFSLKQGGCSEGGLFRLILLYSTWTQILNANVGSYSADTVFSSPSTLSIINCCNLWVPLLKVICLTSKIKTRYVKNVYNFALFFSLKKQLASWRPSLPSPTLQRNLCSNLGFVVKVICLENKKKRKFHGSGQAWKPTAVSLFFPVIKRADEPRANVFCTWRHFLLKLSRFRIGFWVSFKCTRVR